MLENEITEELDSGHDGEKKARFDFCPPCLLPCPLQGTNPLPGRLFPECHLLFCPDFLPGGKGSVDQTLLTY